MSRHLAFFSTLLNIISGSTRFKKCYQLRHHSVDNFLIPVNFYDSQWLGDRYKANEVTFIHFGNSQLTLDLESK